MNETANDTSRTGQGSSNLRVAAFCVALVGAMGGLAYASVPLYQLFCQVTGYGGTTQRAQSEDGIAILDREIVVRFDANTSNGLNWRFRPMQREIRIKVGELAKVSYEAQNLSDRELNGTATFNVTPAALGAYFNKTECFCFTDTRIEPKGKLEMPVVFFIDPEMDQVKELNNIHSVTLSYTFFPGESTTATPERVSQAGITLDKDPGKL